MELSLLFFRRNSIFRIRFFLSRLSLLYLTLVNNNRWYAITLFLLINFFCAKKINKTKKIFNSKVASQILCPLFVLKLQHECEDITKMLGVHR